MTKRLALPAAIAALLTLAACSTTDKRLAGAGAGAAAGAVVAGPIGAAAGGVIGAIAAPSVARKSKQARRRVAY